MSLPTPPVRLMRLIANGSVLIAFFAGSACSRDTLTPEISTNPQLESVQSPAAPQIVGYSEEVESQEAVQTPLGGEDTESRLREANGRIQTQIDEILALYRRLHIELDDSGRSALIVNLFDDPRLELRRLGFELTDRDLSSNTVLTPEVSEAAKVMLRDRSAEIRSKAARLITRLIPPDAMIVLTESLSHETDPIAAEPMLMGISRWPSPEAVDPVLMWFLRADSPFDAASSAAWSIEQAGYWDTLVHHPLLLDRLRYIEQHLLREAGMKLIARLGDASDLERLMALLLVDDQNQQRWAANALVETPRSVELLVQAAEKNDRLFRAASDSLIRHRATPEGLRRLVSLPYPDEGTRIDAIVRMGAALEDDRLAEAVRLANLDSAHTVLLLSRLLNSDIEITTRVAKGIILLAQTELDDLRPNRAFEAAIALDNVSLDAVERSKIISVKATSLILLGKFDEAFEVSSDPEIWLAAMGRTADDELRKRVGFFMLESFGDALSEERVAAVRSVAGIVDTSKAPDDDSAGPQVGSQGEPIVDQDD